MFIEGFVNENACFLILPFPFLQAIELLCVNKLSAVMPKFCRYNCTKNLHEHL